MATNWSARRKFIYGAGTAIALILLGVYTFRDTLFPTPTCFDTKQNGYETGIDCGGTCSLRCSQEVIPLSVTWARAIPTGNSHYDLVALISNKNIDNSPKQIAYTFVAYNKNGKEIARITGASVVPVDTDFPVIEQNLSLKEAPAEVSATVNANVPHYTVAEKPSTPTLRVFNEKYEAGSIPRVYATVQNTKRLVLRNIPVRAVLYDADGNAYAVGQTIIPELGKEGVQDVVFTWDRAFAFPPTKTRIYPILDPFLGSL
jgi:hypothetical protein